MTDSGKCVREVCECNLGRLRKPCYYCEANFRNEIVTSRMGDDSDNSSTMVIVRPGEEGERVYDPELRTGKLPGPWAGSAGIRRSRSRSRARGSRLQAGSAESRFPTRRQSRKQFRLRSKRWSRTRSPQRKRSRSRSRQ